MAMFFYAKAPERELTELRYRPAIVHDQITDPDMSLQHDLVLAGHL
jgi:hypothetical protein